jgi:predicted Holliday junction resolvase-like endonuclease
MENKRISKLAAGAILLIMVFLIIACFKLQMELNELRAECEALEEEVDAARIEVDRREYLKEKQETDPEEYMEEKAYDQGYRNPSDREYINDMPEG